jgi:hypothetical protein
MDPTLRIDERMVTVSDDPVHVKENALHCMIDLPFTISDEDVFYLCFSQGVDESDLQQKNYQFAYACITKGYRCSLTTHDFPLKGGNAAPPILTATRKALWHTVGILIQPEPSTARKNTVDITLSQVVNFVEGDAPVCLYTVTKSLIGTKYTLVDQITLRKRKAALAIGDFQADPVLITSGDGVRFTWSLTGDKTYRLHPFMKEFSSKIPCPYTATLAESTDVVLSVRNFEEGDTSPVEEHATVEASLRVVVREPVIQKLTLSGTSGRETDALIAEPGESVTLRWDVADLGTRTLTLSPPLREGALPQTGSVSFIPADDCTYTLSVASDPPVAKSVSLLLDEVKIVSFAPVQSSACYGDLISFDYKLKNTVAAAINPGVCALDLSQNRASCLLEPNPPTKQVTYTLSGEGKLPSGATKSFSQSCQVAVTDFIEIKSFSVIQDTIDGENYAKVLSWEIAYTGSEVKIEVYVDRKQVMAYNDVGCLTHTEYLNALYHEETELVCTGRNGQKAVKTIQR